MTKTNSAPKKAAPKKAAQVNAGTQAYTDWVMGHRSGNANPMKPTAEQIAEAAKRGIVPGATIRCAYYTGEVGIVGPQKYWRAMSDGAMDVAAEGNLWAKSTYSDPQWATVIKPTKRKTPSQPRVKGMLAANPDPVLERLDRIETYLNKVGQAVVDQGREFQCKLNLIESSVAVIRSGASFMQQLDQDAPVGLQPGDYTDASKEVADKLTAMGWGWVDNDRRRYPFIRVSRFDERLMVNHSEKWNGTHLDAHTFLARARVTAAELGLKAPEPWKPKFGDRVMCNGQEWKVGCDQPSDAGHWRLCPSKADYYTSRLAKLSDFTLID